jgi:hypothetical protein
MWDWSIWGALIVGGIALAAGTALLVVRSLQVWRDFKRTRRCIVRGLDEVAAKGEAATARSAVAGETEELQRSLLRLERSLAQLAVLREAIDEVQDTFAQIGTGVLVPRR